MTLSSEAVVSLSARIAFSSALVDVYVPPLSASPSARTYAPVPVSTVIEPPPGGPPISPLGGASDPGSVVTTVSLAVVSVGADVAVLLEQAVRTDPGSSTNRMMNMLFLFTGLPFFI